MTPDELRDRATLPEDKVFSIVKVHKAKIMEPHSMTSLDRQLLVAARDLALAAAFEAMEPVVRALNNIMNEVPACSCANDGYARYAPRRSPACVYHSIIGNTEVDEAITALADYQALKEGLDGK